jgi:hypothetical protein
MRHFTSAVLVTAILAGSGACVATIRVRDESHGDYHNWDRREDRAYRMYLVERHLEYREFARLDRRDQDDYWQWRHAHPDRGR